MIMEESGLKRLSKILDIFTGLVIQLKKKIGSLLLIFTFGHVDKKKIILVCHSCVQNIICRVNDLFIAKIQLPV